MHQLYLLVSDLLEINALSQKAWGLRMSPQVRQLQARGLTSAIYRHNLDTSTPIIFDLARKVCAGDARRALAVFRLLISVEMLRAGWISTSKCT